MFADSFAGKHKRSGLGTSHLNAFCHHRCDGLGLRKQFWGLLQLNALPSPYFPISVCTQCVWGVFRYCFCAVQDTEMFQTVNFASFSLLTACVNKKPFIGFFWSRGRTVGGGHREEPVSYVKDTCPARLSSGRALRVLCSGSK